MSRSDKASADLQEFIKSFGVCPERVARALVSADHALAAERRRQVKPRKRCTPSDRAASGV